MDSATTRDFVSLLRLAMFYRHDGQAVPSPGIIVLGQIKGSVEALRAPRPVAGLRGACPCRWAVSSPNVA